MKRLEVSVAVRPLLWTLGVKGLNPIFNFNSALSWLACNILSKVTIFSKFFKVFHPLLPIFPSKKIDLHFVT
jgi:hypothetical protein